MSSSSHLLQNRHEGGVLELVLNRPERLNSFTAALKADLAGALAQAGRDAEIGAIVVTGAGDRAFAAGQDLDEAKEFDPSQVDAWIETFEHLYNAILDCPKPIVAALNGYAVGSGLQMAMLCDLRIGSHNTKIGMPEIDDGIPCITGTWSLYDSIGRARTADLIMTGRLIGAEESLSWGVITHLVAPDELNASAIDLARSLASKPAIAMRANKFRLRDLLRTHWESTIATAKVAHTEAYASGVPQQRMADFLAGRRDGRTT